ncbi:hypothetical protein N0V85_003894 [Neurospora sp. IMI 360204]|nr:hypothetical protein N0V85_003894 [Neurospora sp. IMI 360204]
MSEPPDKAELAELLAPSVESIIAKALHEDFPWGRGLLTTHLPLDPTTLEVLCRVNLPKFVVRRDYNSDEVMFTDYGLERKIKFSCRPRDQTKPEQSPGRLCLTIRQCNSYLNAVKSLAQILRGKQRKSGKGFLQTWNYGLENRKSTGFIWVRLTTVVELQYTDHTAECSGSSTGVTIDVRRITTAIDKAMEEHEGPISTVPKACITSATIPARFTIDKMELLRFVFCPSTDSHREFVVQQEEKAFEVNKAANYGPVEGRTAEGVLANDLEVTCRKVKAKAKLTIRIAHKTSMWPTEKVFELQCCSRFERSDTDESLGDFTISKGLESIPKAEPANS